MPHQDCRAHVGDRLQRPVDLALRAIGLVPAGWEGHATSMANVLSSVCMDCYYVFVAMLCDGVDAHDTQACKSR
ncbi:hypothetical protein PF005_g31879 [Phytophthora fragariae]|uniref:Uncharacterized protein n=1 Tax=Phytophthora fragariae TaxID=53985 RepID=A0A6A3VFM2_9STRA|nr:hypothetical protein PF005_g31879 [Phytophthora fragariae]KAE9267023.1 hypothetical protein PF008_g31453 [Phytophthora fragariae]